MYVGSDMEDIQIHKQKVQDRLYERINKLRTQRLVLEKEKISYNLILGVLFCAFFNCFLTFFIDTFYKP